MMNKLKPYKGMQFIITHGSCRRCGHQRFPRLKTLLAMKLMLVLMIATGLQVTARSSDAQNVSLSGRHLPLSEIFRQIHDQAGYQFFYKTEYLSRARPVNIHVRDMAVDKALDICFDGQPLTYAIVGKTIVVTPAKPAFMSAEGAPSDSVFTIKGRVFDTHEPPSGLPGVTISIKGASEGTTTDQDGYFSIQARKNDVLDFSMIGFKTREVTILKAYKSLIVALPENISSLDEVVVEGMNEIQKKHIASSLASLDVQSQIDGKPITTLSQSLQGGVTGLQVTQGSGLPGGDAATIKIRGISTLGNSNPLVLVDGVPMDMNFIDPATVESVTILKDAAAASIYGSRAANGVILVTTKRGTPGNITVSYDGYYGIQGPTALAKLVDAPTYMRMDNESLTNSGKPAAYSDEAIQKTIAGDDPIQYPNTDWEHEIINKSSPISSHSVSVSGGNNLARFALTANYLYQGGMIPLEYQKRYNIRANTSITLSKKFLIYVDLLAIKRNRTNPNRSTGNGGVRILEDVFRVPPTVLPKYPQKDNSPAIYGRYADIVNPLAYSEVGGSINNEYGQVSLNLQPKWEILPGLNLKGQFSYQLYSDVTRSVRDNYNFFDYYTGQLLQNWKIQRSISLTRRTYYYLGATADYTFNVGDHHFYTMAGYSQEEDNSGQWDISTIVSAFAKVNYSYQDKYLLEATFRSDGSSLFGPGHKYGYYPSVALGWNMSKEHFLQDSKTISNLKLRASYGQLGNQNIGLYQYQTTINNSSGVETAYGNPDITWETVNMLDLGMDLGLFHNNKVEIVVDYYDKLTKGIILDPPLSYVGGFEGTVPVNAGKVSNKGWEFSLNYNDRIGKNIRISIKPGITYNDNKIVSLVGGPYIHKSTVENLSTTVINEAGSPIGSFYGYHTDGLLQQSDFKTDGSPGTPTLKGEKPGDIKYVDYNSDGVIDANDESNIGNPTPKLDYFANFKISYKQIDLEFLLQGVGNSEALLSDMLALPLNLSKDGGTPTAYYSRNYWTAERTDARFPRLLSDPANNALASDFWFQNGRYLRLKYIQLGYNLHSTFFKHIGIQSARVYVNAQNSLTITPLKLTDPESRGNQWTYGVMKACIVGVNVQF